MEQWIVVAIVLLGGIGYFYNKIKSGLLKTQQLQLVKEDQDLRDKQNKKEGEIEQLKQQLASDEADQRQKEEAEVLDFWNKDKRK